MSSIRRTDGTWDSPPVSENVREYVTDWEQVFGNRSWFIKSEEILQLWRPRTMTLTKTYPRHVEVCGVRFNIRPYDIVMVASYPELDLNQSIGILLGVVMQKAIQRYDRFT